MNTTAKVPQLPKVRISVALRSKRSTHLKATALAFRYKVFIKYCVFPYNFVIFLNSASSAAALVFYLPGVCTHIDTERKQRKAKKHNI